MSKSYPYHALTVWAKLYTHMHALEFCQAVFLITAFITSINASLNDANISTYTHTHSHAQGVGLTAGPCTSILVIYCVLSSILTLQQSQTLNEAQSSACRDIRIVSWFLRIVAQLTEL